MAQIQIPSLLPQRLFQVPVANDKGYMTDPTWQRIFQTIGQPAAIPSFAQGTHGKRIITDAAKLQDGSIFFENDRLHYYIVNGANWQVLNGLMSGLQTDLPADLTAVDAGFQYFVTDYRHTLLWTGVAWQWGPQENGSGFIVTFPTDPTDFGWAACDGSTVNYLLSAGNVIQQLLPNTPGSWFRQ
jgi:hypothetical protein